MYTVNPGKRIEIDNNKRFSVTWQAILENDMEENNKNDFLNLYTFCLDFSRFSKFFSFFFSTRKKFKS